MTTDICQTASGWDTFICNKCHRETHSGWLCHSCNKWYCSYETRSTEVTDDKSHFARFGNPYYCRCYACENDRTSKNDQIVLEFGTNPHVIQAYPGIIESTKGVPMEYIKNVGNQI
jgi:hypothetical protein